MGKRNNWNRGPSQATQKTEYKNAIFRIAQEVTGDNAPTPLDDHWADQVRANLADARTRALETLRDAQ